MAAVRVSWDHVICDDVGLGIRLTLVVVVIVAFVQLTDRPSGGGHFDEMTKLYHG